MSNPLLIPKIFFFSVLLVVNLDCNRAETASDILTSKQASTSQTKTDVNAGGKTPCLQFDELNTLVRDGLIDRDTARARIKELLPALRDYFYANGGTDSPPDDWVFPLEGYNQRSIGGTRGSGFVPKGYDYFDGNKHGGHPAHDIFITDKNQDGLDDNTHKPINVLSMKNGLVVAIASEWKVGSDLRGGKYIYVFEPATSSLIYYAHNSELFVKPGDVVKAGTVLATVGRSGKNAHPSRSPTHLHIMWLVFDDGYPRPKDLYQLLLKARTIQRR
jgi:murein DD-endopeptidase MepM/ murein hydrolase activator NlpD